MGNNFYARSPSHLYSIIAGAIIDDEDFRLRIALAQRWQSFLRLLASFLAGKTILKGGWRHGSILSGRKFSYEFNRDFILITANRAHSARYGEKIAKGDHLTQGPARNNKRHARETPPTQPGKFRPTRNPSLKHSVRCAHDEPKNQ